ncbi:MAG: GTP-binding protein [Gloeomargarita sp. SKYBB_i_bin120]|nr:GTP-binding protein [Gloeomargarita sp. SKYB120]MDW8178587.1 GTP-binding protein [Gloeomargarita sp. SKYBB_i_bin120]
MATVTAIQDWAALKGAWCYAQAQALSSGSARQRLDQGLVQVVVLGLVGRGKSSLLNALVGEPVFATGAVHGVTQGAQAVQWSLGNVRVELVDTPGLDEVGQTTAEQVWALALGAELVLLVLSGDPNREELGILSRLVRAGKPVMVVLNKMDQYPPDAQALLLSRWQSGQLARWVDPKDVIPVAAQPTTWQRTPQGTVVRQPAPPQVEPLRQRLVQELTQLAPALLALNALHTTAQAPPLSAPPAQIEALIWRASTRKALAVAVNPVFGVDLLVGALMDGALLLRLARRAGVSLSAGEAMQFLQLMAGSLGGLGIGASVLKSSFAVGSGLTWLPYIAVAAGQGALAGLATYLVGRLGWQYLMQDKTWGPGSPAATIQQWLGEIDQGAVLTRLRRYLHSPPAHGLQ